MGWFIKLLKFGLVGSLGMCIDFGTTYLLKEKLKLNKYVSNTGGFTLAVINNYYLNKIWTFNSTQQGLFNDEFLKFVVFAVIGLIMNNAFLFFFHEKIKINFYLSKGLSILCVFLWNFFTNLLFNFR